MTQVNKVAHIHERSGENTADTQSFAELLLTIESQARKIESLEELEYFIANESRRIVGYRQAIVFRKQDSKMLVKAVSSVSVVDRSSFFIIETQHVLRRLQNEIGLGAMREFSPTAYSDQGQDNRQLFPFDNALWIPFIDRNEQEFGGLLMLKEQPWMQQQSIIAKRFGEFYSHALMALEHTKPRSILSRVFTWKKLLASAVLCALAAFIPVPLTTLAPAEVVALTPVVLASPLSGVIDEILIEPNSWVEKGETLVRLNATEQQNSLNVAEQNIAIAEVKLRRAKQSAFQSAEQNHLVITLKEELHKAELDLAFASKQLSLVELKAPVSGIALYGDINDWIGRPVNVGEQILSIADPANIQFRVDVDVQDSIVLNEDAFVKVYLDSDPINPIESSVSSAAYQARVLPNQALAFRVTSSIEESERENLRIGMRGTAKVYGDSVSLFFYLFRRPISWFRQFFGL